MSKYVMRPARLDDYEALMELATLSGMGFTSLPVDEGILRNKLKKSKDAFGGQLSVPQTGKFLLILEDIETGEVAGCSAVKAGTGIDEPFFNYRIITIAQASLSAEKRFDLDALVLTNEFVGYTEVGTLFLRPDHRGGGAGRLAAQSRYLLMAADPDQFGDNVLAELRGVVDSDGNTPFWDHLGQHFFKMSFPEADHLCAISNNQFILDLMPKFPIYIDLLPPDAREAIGRCHADGVGAMKLLEWEGFRFERTVDIFDGGPMVAARREHIRTIRESRLVRLELGDSASSDKANGLISTDSIENFRAMNFAGEVIENERAICTKEEFEVLGLKEGDMARVWIRDDR